MKTVPAILFAALLFLVPAAAQAQSGTQPSSGQRFPSKGALRKPACGCFVCGNMPGMHTVMFEDKKDCAGILAEDACGEHLANIPKEKGEAFCQRIKAKLKFTSFKDSCPSLAPYCEPEAEKAPDTAGGGAIPPPADPGRDGLEDGFSGGPPAGRPPVRPPASPRLVYLKHVPGASEPVREFTVWLDRTGCPVPIAANNKPADPAAAIHVVRGRIARSDGHVRIEAEARELKGGRKRGPFLEYAAGEDTAAVAAATRVVLRQLDLVCSR